MAGPEQENEWRAEFERLGELLVYDNVKQGAIYNDEPQRQMSMKRLSRDEAFLIAVNIAKLPSVPRQILKDTTAAAKLSQPRRLSASGRPSRWPFACGA